MLTILHAHRDEVVRLTPLTAARVSCLWLRTMPTELHSGRPMPWRPEAAALAVAVAREVQASNAEGNRLSQTKHQVVYEAVLYAASDLPEEVASLCLELAQRRDPSPQIKARANQARLTREEERRRWREANPELTRKRQRLPSPLSVGNLREPWPDGPHDSVDQGFQKACLTSAAFSALSRVRPAAALEILLAVCIEEPQHERRYHHAPRFGDFGLEPWHDGYPPLHFRGPFLAFLRQAPHHGLSFVLRLVNFATHRYVGSVQRWVPGGSPEHEANPGVTMLIDSQRQRWLGDSIVFQWHHGAPHASYLIPNTLMALEQWLYEQLDAGSDIGPWLARILAESKSVAFAGLLVEIGKKKPILFGEVLLPLLRAWELYEWDAVATVSQAGMNQGTTAWGMQPKRLADLARKWHGLPHRSYLLRDVVIWMMLSKDDLRPFFEEVRAHWEACLDATATPAILRLLIEQLNPGNYTISPHGQNEFLIHFQWPEAIARKNAEDLRRSNERLQLLTLPLRCRRWLDAGTPLPQNEIFPFWEVLQDIDTDLPAPPKELGHALMYIEDAVYSGIAVLLVLNYDWVAADPARMRWCRRKLETLIQHPPQWSTMDHIGSGGNLRWDAFIAECGVTLLAKDRKDPLARSLVSVSLTRITTRLRH